MQADVECDEIVVMSDGNGDDIELDRELAWLESMRLAVVSARAFSAAGYHKQIVNRLLEPFAHVNVVCTSTQWSNFFALRDHSDAQPEISILAREMKRVMAASTPKLLGVGEWHLPYCDDLSKFSDIDVAIKCSVARCARVSYVTHDGKIPSIDADLNLYDRLITSIPAHMSPSEHQATPDEQIDGGKWRQCKLHGNFVGWVQYRKTLPNECL